MDQEKNIETSLAGQDVSISLAEINDFHEYLLKAYDQMGDEIMSKVPDPASLAMVLCSIGTDWVVNDSNPVQAEQALRTAARIFRKLGPAYDLLVAEILRFLGTVLCRNEKCAEAQGCNMEAGYLLKCAGLSL